jgi:hypothetical protein
MYSRGTGKMSKLMNRFLHEFLDLTLAIILTVLFCKVNIILLLGELPQKIIPYFIMELKLIDLHCSNELRCKFKEDDFLNFRKCLRKYKYPNMSQKAIVCARLFRSTYICEQASSLLNLNKCTQRTGWHENLTLVF